MVERKCQIICQHISSLALWSMSLNDSTFQPSDETSDAIVKDLRASGFVRLEAPAMLRLLGDEAGTSWESFSALWDDLGKDLYMADGGRYRRRRYAAFAYAGERSRASRTSRISRAGTIMNSMVTCSAGSSRYWPRRRTIRSPAPYWHSARRSSRPRTPEP